MQQRDFITLSLTTAQCLQLDTLARQVKTYWEHPAPGMLLCYEHALMELSLLVYESGFRGTSDQRTSTHHRVQTALTYFTRNMADNPSLPEVAAAAHISPAHLRRLFQAELQTSPKSIFNQLRFQRAMQLLTDTDLKLGAIAEQCGFMEPSTFSRAFKQKFGCSPIQIKNPASNI